MRRFQHPRSDFDAKHLEAWLPLAVGAVLQAEGAKLLLADCAAAEQLNALFKAGYLRFDGFTAVPFFNFGQGFYRHDS
jgi:hypothetical protein